MHVGIVRQIFAHSIADAHELALDDAFFSFASRGQQHVTIASGETCLSVRDGVRGKPKAARERREQRVYGLMCRASREIHGSYQQRQQDERRKQLARA